MSPSVAARHCSHRPTGPWPLRTVTWRFLLQEMAVAKVICAVTTAGHGRSREPQRGDSPCRRVGVVRRGRAKPSTLQVARAWWAKGLKRQRSSLALSREGSRLGPAALCRGPGRNGSWGARWILGHPLGASHGALLAA